MFKNKTAIVTGGAKGIGLGIASALAKESANVILGDLDDLANEKSAREIEELTNSKCMAIHCDVTKKEEVEDEDVKTHEINMQSINSVDTLIDYIDGVLGKDGKIMPNTWKIWLKIPATH